MAVAGAGSPLRRSCAALASPFIAVAPQGRVQFRFKQLLDEAADPAANPSFQGIEPVIAKKMSSLGGINRCLRVIRRHGVISVGVPTPILFAFTSWRLRHLQISTTLATPPLECRGGTLDDYAFPSRIDHADHISTRQYARLVDEWVTGIGLRREDYGTHSLRRTKASIIYKQTGNLRAVQILLGHTKIESTVRYLGVDIEDALALAEGTEV